MQPSHKKNTVQKVCDIELQGLSPRIWNGIKKQMERSMTRLPFLQNIEAMNRTTMDLDVQMDESMGAGIADNNNYRATQWGGSAPRERPFRRFGSV